MYGATSGDILFDPPATVTSYTVTPPAAAATAAGQVQASTGANATMEWKTPAMLGTDSKVSTDVLPTPLGNKGQLQIWDKVADTGAGELAFSGVTVAPNGDVYACVYGGDIYVQTGGVGAFVALGETSRQWYDIAAAPDGDIYAVVYGGDVYKRTAGAGAFTGLGETTRNWYSIKAMPNGNIYAGVFVGDVYMQTNGSGAFNALSQTSRLWSGFAGASNGDVYATVEALGNNIYKQTGGTGNFVSIGETARDWSGIAILGSDYYAVVKNGGLYKQTGGSGAFTDVGAQSRSWNDVAASATTIYLSAITTGKGAGLFTLRDSYVGSTLKAPSSVGAGGTLLVDAAGQLSVSTATGTSTYTLPIATDTVLGGVKASPTVAVATDGSMSVSTNYLAPPTAPPYYCGGAGTALTSSSAGTTQCTSVVGPSRNVGTASGLQGGGNLTADLTLSPVYGSSANTVMQGNDRSWAVPVANQGLVIAVAGDTPDVLYNRLVVTGGITENVIGSAPSRQVQISLINVPTATPAAGASPLADPSATLNNWVTKAPMISTSGSSTDISDGTGSWSSSYIVAYMDNICSTGETNVRTKLTLTAQGTSNGTALCHFGLFRNTDTATPLVQAHHTATGAGNYWTSSAVNIAASGLGYGDEVRLRVRVDSAGSTCTALAGSTVILDRVRN